jgi:hypothetical protein
MCGGHPTIYHCEIRKTHPVTCSSASTLNTTKASRLILLPAFTGILLMQNTRRVSQQNIGCGGRCNRVLGFLTSKWGNHKSRRIKLKFSQPKRLVAPIWTCVQHGSLHCFGGWCHYNHHLKPNSMIGVSDTAKFLCHGRIAGTTLYARTWLQSTWSAITEHRLLMT